MNDKPMKRFDRLLEAMATRPPPLEKPAKDNQTSGKARGAGYGDTRTREGKSEATSMSLIGTCDCCDAQHTTLTRVMAAGIETSACMVCTDETDPNELADEIERLIPKAEWTADWAFICLLEQRMLKQHCLRQ